MVSESDIEVEFAEREPLDDPHEWFDLWLAAVDELEIKYANAMTLATADGSGAPHARTVLLKSRDERGFVFYTNYRSAKGRDLDENPRASLQVYWRAIDRQFRLEGSVERLDDQESDDYFASRPRGSQIGAWASDQSRPLDSREALMERYREIEERFDGEPVPRPPHWGGYRLVAERMVFWRAGASRLHDRWAFLPEDGDWRRQRLNP